ncbi:MAG: hypothetical protein ACK5LS_14085 [Propioniciclava sp.]
MSSTPTIEAPTAEPTVPEAPERPRFELSPTAVVAGALASLTSAFLGSTLGTAGTIIGAAIGSMIGAVATALYSFWLRRATSSVASLAGRTRPDAARSSAVGRPSAEDRPAPTDASRSPSRIRPRAVVASVIAASAIAFVLSLIAITALETGTGRSLSGGTGTTVASIPDRDSSDPDTTNSAPPPADEESTEVPEPDQEVPAEDAEDIDPSPEPTTPVSSEPTPEPTPAVPSTTPKAEADAAAGMISAL